ncbi:cytokinesis protein 3, partial [Nowakowskiella sp. JEL0078]
MATSSSGSSSYLTRLGFLNNDPIYGAIERNSKAKLTHTKSLPPLPGTPKAATVFSGSDRSSQSGLTAVQPNLFNVMLSYSQKDSHVVDQVDAHLRDAGFTVWRDIREMTANIYDRMVEGVVNSSIVICFISTNYENSENCKRELCLAGDLRKPIMPIFVDNVKQCWSQILTSGRLRIYVTSPDVGEVQLENIVRE